MFCDELKKRFAVLYNGKSCRPVLSSISGYLQTVKHIVGICWRRGRFQGPE